MKNRSCTAPLFAILAAALYAVNIPLSKLLLEYVSPTMMAAFLYLGAGLGLLIWSLCSRAAGAISVKPRLTRSDLPYTAAMVVLDIAAPILLMFGIARECAASVSLLSNFEIVSTALIALAVFGEAISKRLWLSIGIMTAASIILSVDGSARFSFNEGSLLVLAACVCWGFENNCTRKLSGKSSIEIVTIKGCFSGAGSLIVALCLGEPFPAFKWAALTLLLGFVAYGLSINFYIMAQKDLGAAKTSAYYSTAPFIGVVFGMLLLGERPDLKFYAALAIMAAATALMTRDTILLQHTHGHIHVHTHEHSHGDVVHTHEHAHTHSHIHVHAVSGDSHMHSPDELSYHNHEHTSI